MRKRIAALVLVALGSAALASAAQAVETGIILGLNLSRLSGRVLDLNWGTKGGFTAGAVVTFSLTDFFALQPGLFFAQKGGLHEEPYEGGKLRLAMRLSYFDLPILARLSLPLGAEAKFRPYLLGGVSYSLKLSAKFRTDFIDEYELENTLDESPVEGLKNGGLNAVFGAGFDSRISNGRFLFEGRFSRSLSTISTEGLNLRLAVFSILVGFSF